MKIQHGSSLTATDCIFTDSCPWFVFSSVELSPVLINTKNWWGSMLTLAYSSNHSFSLKVGWGGYLFRHAIENCTTVTSGISLSCNYSNWLPKVAPVPCPKLADRVCCEQEGDTVILRQTVNMWGWDMWAVGSWILVFWRHWSGNLM